MIKKKLIGLYKALRYSLAGLWSALLTEPSFMIEVIGCLVLIPVACLLPIPLIQKSLLIGSLFLVLIVELLNSAIEAIVDRVSIELHPLSKKAKDYGSAAVFLSLIIVVMIWSAVIFTRYFS